MILLTRNEYQAKAAYVKDLQTAIIKMSSEIHGGNHRASTAELIELIDEIEAIHAEWPEITTGQSYTKYLSIRVSGSLAAA